MEFYDQAGKVAIGSRLRMLTDIITADAEKIYQLYQVNLQPKWFPVFHLLCEGGESVTGIARKIGHSHPSVSKIVSEMVADGLVKEKKDPQDGRRNLVSLTAKGKKAAEKLATQLQDVEAAVEEILQATRNDLWKAIGEWEFLLEQKSLFRRVEAQRKKRESAEVVIVDFQPRHAAAFRALNEQWISTYFKMEAADYKALDHPKKYILDKGGAILIALLDNQPVGAVALIKMNDPVYDFELAKMAVSPEARGKNIGLLLGQAAIGKAKELGATNLYLESNTILKPAINLYHKLGFEKVAGHATPYERCNIQMALVV
ncbi:bifunctional helix-turn-helix transcriptional regulator/GNAT family N-acetyltransferase [Flavihumibacter petaseus]|uniref:Putative MarR family transcriptional regulator n=1 Tax=Flavihumibacter petaseus NBRC 106054 TaxID=1220578 RepID=A0A0E9N4C5_9BACT|nr:helix-turn-helix domain-containing GNAT family N-acetyltransferase [Flavihumibacter petaseus]GAO44511.1 putative MarR family transcriptional regulator [Flavihumibacter petaseus NBRC 106054]